MESKFEKVSLKVKVQLLGGNPVEDIYPLHKEIYADVVFWKFLMAGQEYSYSEQTIKDNPECFEVIYKKEKVKSAVMKTKLEWSEGLKSYYDPVSTEFYSEDFMLRHPDKFIIEYED